MLLAVVATVAFWAQAGPGQEPRCELTLLRRDTMHLTVYAFAPPRKRFERSAEHAFREQQAEIVIRLIDSIPVVSLPAFVGAASAPEDPNAYTLLDLLGKVWFQVGDDGRLAGLRLAEPTGSLELNRALVAAVLKADSLRLLTAPPPRLRGRAIDVSIVVQTGRPKKVASVPIARATIVFARIDSSAVLLPGHRKAQMPAAAMATQTGDSLLVDYVIDEHGVPDLSTLQFRQAGYREFAQEVVQSIATFRFKPAMSRGCAVRQRVCQPWRFVWR
jgi:hypothetical protein